MSTLSELIDKSGFVEDFMTGKSQDEPPVEPISISLQAMVKQLKKHQRFQFRMVLLLSKAVFFTEMRTAHFAA